MIGVFFAVRAHVAAHASRECPERQNQRRGIVPLRMNRVIVVCAVVHASGAWKTLTMYVLSCTPLRTVIWPHLRGAKARDPASAPAATASAESESDREEQPRARVRLPPSPSTFRAFCLMNFSTASYASSSTICFGGDFIR